MSETLTMAFAPSPTATLEFEALYRSCADELYGYVVSLVRDRAAARRSPSSGPIDAAAGSIPGKGTPRQAPFAIARNAALDELRRRKRTASLLVAILPTWSPAEPFAGRGRRGPSGHRPFGARRARPA